MDFDGSLDRNKMEFFIGELLWEGKDTLGIEIMRCKGIFTDDKGQSYVLQGVQDLFEFREVESNPEKRARFLFVGKGPIEAEGISE